MSEFVTSSLVHSKINRVSTIECPSILFVSLTTDGGGFNMGNGIFWILDTVKHEGGYPCQKQGIPAKIHSKCFICESSEPVPANKVILTQFIINPNLTLAVRGPKSICTLQEKVNILYNTTHPNTDLLNFFYQIIIYGCARYMIARLLYGDFNLSYLERRFTEKFMSDLRRSRYCKFENIFYDQRIIGYDRYYKCEIKC